MTMYAAFFVASNTIPCAQSTSRNRLAEAELSLSVYTPKSGRQAANSPNFSMRWHEIPDKNVSHDV